MLPEKAPSPAILLQQLNTLDPCVTDLRQFFSEKRREYRDRVFSNNPISTPNQAPIDGDEDKDYGLVDTWITIEQIEKAQEKLQGALAKLQDANPNDIDYEEISTTVREVYQLVTSRAVNLRYFDLWRGTHNFHPDVVQVLAWACFCIAFVLQAAKGEDTRWRIIAGIAATLLILFPLLSNLPDPKQAHSNRVRKKLHKVFKSAEQ
jgi:hypothetical protein